MVFLSGCVASLMPDDVAVFVGKLAMATVLPRMKNFMDFGGICSSVPMASLQDLRSLFSNGDEREALWDLLPEIQGLLIGDKGYISAWLRQELQRYGLDLQTALRSNMCDVRPKFWIWLLGTVRRLIETVNEQLAVRFHIERVRARDMWHLTSRLHRKLLAHTLCCYLNRLTGHELLQFDALVV